METGIITAVYLVAAVLFIQSLGGLSTQETARRTTLRSARTAAVLMSRWISSLHSTGPN